MRHNKSLNDETGSVMLLVVLAMVVLCGFGALVLDLGALYVEKERVQAGADAGALAGADVLLQGSTQAAQQAIETAAQNDSHPPYTATADTNTDEVTVTAAESVPLWFAKILGQQTATLHVTSTAQIGVLTSGVGMVPIAVPSQNFAYGEEVSLTQGAGDGSSGNYGLLDFNGAGNLSNDIAYGYNSSLYVGEQISTLPGLHVGPVSSGIDIRMAENNGDSSCNAFSTVKSDCPRVIYLPVVNTLAVNGKKDVTIVGFAAFFLDGFDGSGGHEQVMGRFLQIVRPGTVGIGNNYGAFTERLTGQ